MTIDLAEQTGSGPRMSIALLNWAHALDHFVMLIYPTVVIGLEAVYAKSYSELIALSTVSFIAFGVFSLPAGWLADHWSRRNMMAMFYIGCGFSLAAAGMAPNAFALAMALAMLGVFASIYHPVGMAMLIELSQARGRTLAFNGVCGNLGAALAAGITAAIAWFLGWRAAFFIPAAICLVSGIAYLALTTDDRHQKAGRKSAPARRLSTRAMLMLFTCFIVVALTGGLIFNAMSVALPKIVDERLGRDLSLLAVGGLATAVFLCGALAQLSVGRLAEHFTPHILFAIVIVLEFIGILWAAHASGVMLMLALVLTMGAIYGQITLNDIVLARYTADKWRGRVYAVRYFLIFITSGAGVALIAVLHGRGGFDLVLITIAAVAGILVLGAFGIVAIVSNAENRHLHATAPAE